MFVTADAVQRSGPLVKRLRHRPFTAVTRVQISYGSPFGSIAQLGEHLPYKQRVIGSSPIVPTRKNDLFRQVVFSVIFACGKLYCCAVIFGLRRVILCFAQFNGKYNITETEGFNITFVLTKISLQRSWNITKKFLHLYCSALPEKNIR